MQHMLSLAALWLHQVIFSDIRKEDIIQQILQQLQLLLHVNQWSFKNLQYRAPLNLQIKLYST